MAWPRFPPGAPREERAVAHYDLCDEYRCEYPDVEVGRKLFELLDEKKTNFERTGSPVEAWDAWHFCREA